MRFRNFVSTVCAIALPAFAQSPTTMPATQPSPSVILEHGTLKALVYRPDVNLGHYRGTRFDWSGMIGHLEHEGYVYWDEWNPSNDPAGDHDNAVGAALEFGMTSPLGFDEAKPGEGFIKIGVGVLQKPTDGKPYFFRNNYKILDPGQWTFVEKEKGRSVVMKQVVSSGEWGYEYTKVIWLSGDSELLVECELKNTGRRKIVTDVYNHNFFRPGARGFEPPIEVAFDQPVTLDPKAKLAGSAEMNRTFKVTRPLTKSVWAPLVFGAGGAPREFQLTKGDRVMSVTHSFTPSKYLIYGLAQFIAIEPFMDIDLEPGKSVRWSYTYSFNRQV